jgi:putative tryptophan/tyrosine transport system substrate-binding protein
MKRGTWLLLGVLLTIGTAPAMAVDKTVGVVMFGNIGYYQEMHKAFVAALAAEEFDHRKVDMPLQKPSPDPLSWTNAARKLSVAEVNALVTYGASATLAAISETKGIPIIFAGVYDPNTVGVSARTSPASAPRRR